MAAFSHSGRNVKITFKAAYPPVASASCAVWGQWRTETSVFRNSGPQNRNIPSSVPSSNDLLMNDLTMVDASSNSAGSDPTADYNQCVFLRGLHIRKRKRDLFPKVIKAAAGPHDLGSGHRDDESAAQLRGDEQASDVELSDGSDCSVHVEPIVDTHPVS
jgi:hypothetical protein